MTTHSWDNNITGELPAVFPIIIIIHFPNLVSKLVALVVGESDNTTGFSRDFGKLVIVFVIPRFVPKSKLQVGYIWCKTS